jgi:diacylglycerol kinase (ATP)
MNQSETKTEQQAPESRPWRHERKGVIRSFRYAWDGVLHAFLTQRHMRVHAVVIVLVLLAAWGLDVSPENMLHLMAAMCLVIIAEMFNTTLEMVVDMIEEGYHPTAKAIKDMAAGAVLIATLYAVGAGFLIFFTNRNLQYAVTHMQYPPEPTPLRALSVVIIGSVLAGAFIAYLKYRTKRGTLWRGGIVSGHTALGFLITTSVFVLTRDLAVTALALAMAVLISQSRLQARIHSPLEILLGALVGTLTALLLFMLPIFLSG